MRRVKLTANQVGLVFKNGAYTRLLTAGTYWFWKRKDVYVYDITEPFVSPVELNLLLQDEELANRLQLVEVSDTEMVLLYQNGLFKEVLTPGRYTYWKSVIDYRFVRVNLSTIEIPESIDRALLARAPLSNWVRTEEVQNYEKALLFVNGKYTGILESGTWYWWKNSTTVQVVRVDTRVLQLEINGQEILTRDKAALRMNAWAQYRVTDMEKAVLQNKEYEKQLYVAMQLALREYIAGYGLDELLEKKQSIAPIVLDVLKQKASELGVEMNSFGIRDIILPGDVKEIMNQVLVAEKKAQANSIMRREETASTRSLLNTARLMEDNSMLWKLKEMEYVEKIADKISSISVSGNGLIVEQLKQLFVSPVNPKEQ